MDGKTIIQMLRTLADQMEAHKPDGELLHLLAIELVVIDCNVNDTTPAQSVLRNLSKFVDDLADEA